MPSTARPSRLDEICATHEPSSDETCPESADSARATASAAVSLGAAADAVPAATLAGVATVGADADGTEPGGVER